MTETVWHPFGASVQFLTRFPLPAAIPFTPPVLTRSLVFFPAAGALIGALLAGCAYLFDLALPALPAAALLLAVWVCASGGLHLDGLMDTADGVLSGRSRERMLEIMKDSRVGAMGVLAAILVLLLKFSLLCSLLQSADWGTCLPLLFAVPVWSRWWMSLAIVRWPYAGGENGLGSYFRGANMGRIWGSLLVGVALTAAGARIGAFSPVETIMLCALALLLCLAAGTVSAQWISRRLGGLTGDTYGALNELLEAALLLAAVAAIAG
ncbi:hypothetical protein VN24_21380 [Paenibacillus beijingensis]|uniref:Adenosylcobinamide-GDP ribazoletransferase n=1 Tax=Paenibacillus beijingensis TaxID=1126833 RepID=A0A0D5NRF7_9BACL|nr:hypothetical protein VN24_21380 [Paenibacillus beijingensis]